MSISLGQVPKAVDAKSATSTTTIVTAPCWMRGIHYNDASGGSAGTVVFRNGGASGKILLTINTPGQGAGDDVVIPGSGIYFDTDVHVTLSNVDGVTVFYNR